MILNNRTVSYYDFESLMEDFNIFPIIVINKPSYNALPENIKSKIPRIHILETGNQKADPTYTFNHKDIVTLFENERLLYPDLKIVASDEMSALVAAQVRETFEIPGLPLETINVYRNKISQKTKLQKYHIRTPTFEEVDFTHIKSIEDTYNNLRNKLGEDFIIKPALAVATVGVTRVTCQSDLESYQKNYGMMGKSIAESYVKGQLYHVDFIVQSGMYIFEEACEYVWNGLSFVSGKNHGSLMLNAQHRLRTKILNFARKANDVLGLTNGCVHMELFVTPEEDIIFLEAGPRPAGSLVSYVYTHAHKRSFMNAALLAEMGIKQNAFDTPNLYGFWGLFPTASGTVKTRHTPDIKSPFTFEWFVQPGDSLPSPTSISDKAAHITAFNTDYNQLRHDFETLRFFQALTLS